MQPKFSECLRLFSKKRGHYLLIVAAMDVLPHGSGNFGHDPSLGIFDKNWGNFWTLLEKSSSKNLATLV